MLFIQFFTKTERINLPNYFINPYSSLSYILQIEELEIKKMFGNMVVKWFGMIEKTLKGDYHPNLNGYKIISDYIYEEIKKIEDLMDKVKNKYHFGIVI